MVMNVMDMLLCYCVWQALLSQRADQLKQGLRELVQEKEGLENQLQVTLTNTDILETWLRANDKGITSVTLMTYLSLLVPFRSNC